MKMRATATTGRVSALQRLGSSAAGKTNVHQRLGLPADARDLLTKRQQEKPIADARQLLSRPSASAPMTKTVPTKITIKNDAVAPKVPKKVVAPTDSSAKQKIVISLVNDQYKKKAPSPPPAVIKRPQVTTTNERRKRTRDEDDDDEAPERPQPLAKRLSVRKPLKEPEEAKPSPSPMSSSTILITNLQASVTEDDVSELFGEIGRISEIQTLSHGCVQVTYTKEEHAKQAISKYHNRLLDGQLMYVSLQPQISYTTKSAKKTTTAEPSASTSESSSSKKKELTIDPTFIRQALFNPSSSDSNPVRFQVKL